MHHPHLSEGLAQLSQDALFIEHLPLVAVLIVIMDALPHVCRELVEGHILLHLLVLHRGEKKKRELPAMQQMAPTWGQIHTTGFPYLTPSHQAGLDKAGKSGAGQSNCLNTRQACRHLYYVS